MPAKADSPLPIDSDAVLAFSLALEALQTIGRKHSQMIQGRGGMQQLQLPEGNLANILKLPCELKVEELLSVLATESLNPFKSYYQEM